MVYDRYFGWDWDRIRAITMMLLFLNLFLMFIFATEGKPWHYHFSYIGGSLANNFVAAMVLLIFITVGLWYWWRFEQGDL